MVSLVLVAGAGGFIGGQLVRDLEQQGIAVRAVDRKPIEDWYYRSLKAENLVLDLKDIEACNISTQGVTQVYNLAADMGGDHQTGGHDSRRTHDRDECRGRTRFRAVRASR